MKTMDKKEAKSVIAAYLSGIRHVSLEELEEATYIVKQDTEYKKQLGSALGVTTEYINICEVFRENAAEFSELSEEARMRLMPELVEHVSSCAACKELFWLVKPLWIEEPAPATAQAVSIVKVLSEKMTAALDVTQGLLQKLGLLPSDEPALARGTIMGPQILTLRGHGESDVSRGSALLVWDLHDEEAKCTIHVEAVGAKKGKICLHVKLTSENSELVVEKAHITVTETMDKSTTCVGLLQRYQRTGIEIDKKGSYEISLKAQLKDNTTYGWIIPLEIV